MQLMKISKCRTCTRYVRKMHSQAFRQFRDEKKKGEQNETRRVTRARALSCYLCRRTFTSKSTWQLYRELEK